MIAADTLSRAYINSEFKDNFEMAYTVPYLIKALTNIPTSYS